MRTTELSDFIGQLKNKPAKKS